MIAYEVKNQAPSPEEYKYLCESVGWGTDINFAAAEVSLNNSLHCVTVRDAGQVIGMGRIVGDGAIYFYIQDIAVHPDYQKKGVGSEIMNRLVTYLHSQAPDKAFIGLFAAKGTEAFYERYDFKNYAPDMTGMFTVIHSSQ